jgi:CubicO group peptidase (beta-lactamase class C family)
MNFSRLTDYIDSVEKIFGLPGCDCSVYFKNKEVFRKSCGYRDKAKTQPVSDDDLYWLYSATKVSTCVAAMQLVEKGFMQLTDRVSKYLPEFKNLKVQKGDVVAPCETEPVIEDLLSMRAGLNYNMDRPDILDYVKKNGQMATTREVIREWMSAPLDFEPGTHFQYSMCHDVLGAVIEVVCGEKFGDFVKENVIRPLGMKDFEYHLLPENEKRLSAQYKYNIATGEMEDVGRSNRDFLSAAYESGGAGGVTRVSDYVLLADALANDGVGVTGARILTRESIDNMRTNRLNAAQIADFRKMSKYGYGYGLGVRTLIYKGVSESPIGEFGWDGLAGAFLLADPESHIAIFYCQHVINFIDVYTVIHPKVRDLTYLALQDEM